MPIEGFLQGDLDNSDASTISTICLSQPTTDNQPAVSYVEAKRYQTRHEGGISDPLDEQTFLVDTINALEQVKQWKSVAIIIAIDDSDADYDHQMIPILNGSDVIDRRAQ